jgi:hypothetical protein
VNPGTHNSGDSDVKGNKPMNDALRKRASRPSRLPARAADERNQWLVDLAHGKRPDDDED